MIFLVSNFKDSKIIEKPEFFKFLP